MYSEVVECKTIEFGEAVAYSGYISVPAKSIGFPRKHSAEKAKKEELTMNTVTVKTDETQTSQRRYLKDRAYEIKCEKKLELKKAFGLTDTPQPKTAKEVIDFIKAGNFVLSEKDQDRKLYHGQDAFAYGYIRFRDPKVKEDRAGYEAAKELVEKDYSALSDDIVILDPKEGLEKLRAFEAKSFQ